MKFRAAPWLLFLALGLILAGVTGCTTDEPDNASVRPWNAPQSWEGGMPMMNQQHPQ
jgi:hypothetical protein